MATDTSRQKSGIQKTPGVCGGRACVQGHRIPVWGLVRYRQLAMSDVEILKAYPMLTPADLQAAWEYYAANRVEIDHDIAENEAHDDLAE
jgi:type III restriction enzyme